MTKTAKSPYIGQKIKAIRPMTEDEIAREDWIKGTTVIELENGIVLYPSQDAEGNGPGEIFGNNPKTGEFMLVGEKPTEARIEMPVARIEMPVEVTDLQQFMKEGFPGYDDARKEKFKEIGKRFVWDIFLALRELTNKELPHKISFNAGGIAVSGDHHLKVMFSEDKGVHLFFGAEMPHLGMCYRSIKSLDDHTGGPNHWYKFENLGHPAKFLGALMEVANEPKN